RGKPASPDTFALYELVDTAGDCVGEIWVSHRIASEHQIETAAFILLSWGKSLDSSYVAKKYVPQRTKIKDEGTTQLVDVDRSEWIVGNVILVNWDRTGIIAHRVALGKVVKTALDQEIWEERRVFLA